MALKCDTWGFHGDDDDNDDVYLGFGTGKCQNFGETYIVTIFSPEDRYRKFIWNVGIYGWVYTAPKLRRKTSIKIFLHLNMS